MKCVDLLPLYQFYNPKFSKEYHCFFLWLVWINQQLIDWLFWVGTYNLTLVSAGDILGFVLFSYHIYGRKRFKVGIGWHDYGGLVCPKICGLGQQAGDPERWFSSSSCSRRPSFGEPGRTNVAGEVQRLSAGEFSLAWVDSGLQLVGWSLPMLQRATASLKIHWFKVNFTPKHLTEILRIIFDQISGHLVKQPSGIHKINHYNNVLNNLNLSS